MTTPDPKLSEMINNAPVKVEASEKQITQIEDTQEELQEEIDAIEDNVCGVAADDLRTYLQGTKLTALRAVYPATIDYGELQFVEGSTYGSIDYDTGNITDWKYRQEILATSGTYIDRYSYVPELNWDADQIIIDFVDDFNFGNDYLTRPLDSGASYGLYPLYAAYGSAKSNVTANKNKVEASVDVLERYL